MAGEAQDFIGTDCGQFNGATPEDFSGGGFPQT